jgi:hypothetical protein
MSKPLIFLSYNGKDEAQKNRLVAHLNVLKHVGLIEVWCESHDGTGVSTIGSDHAIEQAQLAILIVSRNFLSVETLPVLQLTRLLQRARNNDLTIFPVIVEPCNWQKSEWLKQLNVRPKSQEPVWRDGGKYADEELAAFVEEIAELIKSIPLSGKGIAAGQTDGNTRLADETKPAISRSGFLDYERGLDLLRAQLEQTNRYVEFTTLEARLRENLKDEHLFGSNETTRAERARIVKSLNKLALEVLKLSFNDLALGRVSTAGRTPARQLSLVNKLNVKLSPETIEPPIRPKIQELPFNKLTWEQFEALCAALIEAQPITIDTHLFGVRGDEQLGIDIVARQRGLDRTEIWAYQCKRYKDYSPGKLKQAIKKFKYPADYYVLMLSIPATAAIRQVADDQPNVFLWDALDISRKLKNYPALVEDFFGRSWREAFCSETHPMREQQ